MDNDSPSAFGLAPDDLLELFSSGEMEIEGRMPYSSNATLLVEVSDEAKSMSHRAIYKPGKGERPLWDFPPNLYRREVAMYRLAKALGWDVIPPTTVGTGPLGEGSVQAFVNADFSEHYFTLIENGVGIEDLKQLCLLDLIANNTDRKSGHCLLGVDGLVYGIDHGLAFHEEFKLRTVIWDFVGDPISAEALSSMEALFSDGLDEELACLLSPAEQQAVLRRLGWLIETKVFPEDDTGGHRYPWPLV